MSFSFFIYVSVSPVQTLNVARTEILKTGLVSDWGSEFIQPPFAMRIFSILIVTLLLLLIFDIGKNIMENSQSSKYEIYLDLAIFIFLVALVFDQRGTDAGLRLLLYRIFGMSGALIAFLTMQSEFFKKSI